VSTKDATDRGVASGVAAPSVDHSGLQSLVATLQQPDCPQRGMVSLGELQLEYLAPKAFASTLELLFRDRIYDVGPTSGVSNIIDGGGWLGLSTIRFRQLFPDAHITVFEPDPDVFSMMCRNLDRNGIDRVTPVQAALAGEDGEQTFWATGSDSGTLDATVRQGEQIVVTTQRLSRFIDDSTSLLKLNIEGTEAAVIHELGDRLAMIDHVLIEYHGFSELPQTLHRILADLDRNGHTYILSHFDERNRSCVPPLRLSEDFRYFLLIYSRRLVA
jgi:FkbM family methyltransferase